MCNAIFNGSVAPHHLNRSRAAQLACRILLLTVSVPLAATYFRQSSPRICTTVGLCARGLVPENTSIEAYPDTDSSSQRWDDHMHDVKCTFVQCTSSWRMETLR